jgi:hypothetical protein
MALREFVGDDGQNWQVWDTRPTTPAGDSPRGDAREGPVEKATELPLISKKREAGWLTFTSTAERRRLSPIPDDWERADETSLRALARAADRIAG